MAFCYNFIQCLFDAHYSFITCVSYLIRPSLDMCCIMRMDILVSIISSSTHISPPPKNMAILKVGVECYGDRGLLPQNSTATWARCHNHSMIMVIIKIMIMIVIMTTMTAAIMTMNTTMAMTMNMTS